MPSFAAGSRTVTLVGTVRHVIPSSTASISARHPPNLRCARMVYQCTDSYHATACPLDG